MAEISGSGEDATGVTEARAPQVRRVETQYFSTARTAPRAAGESRIGTDEAHERLMAARYRALREPHDARIDDVSADQ